MTIFKEILKASRNNQANIFAFTFKIKHDTIILSATDKSQCSVFHANHIKILHYVHESLQCDDVEEA